MSEVLTVEETPAFVTAGEETLFGVAGSPASEDRGSCLYFVPAGDYFRAASAAPFAIRLCREANALGYHSFRFDYHGVGDSTGTIPRFDLENPLVGDLHAVTAWMQGRGVRRKVLAGFCFGAMSALLAAKEDPDVEAMVLISPPPHAGSARFAMRWSVGAYLRRGLRPRTIRALLTDAERRAMSGRILRSKALAVRSRLRDLLKPGASREGARDRWVSRDFLDSLEQITGRGVPILIIYGTEDDEYEDFVQAQSGRLGRILERAGPLIEVVTLPGWVHGFYRIGVQATSLRLILDWLSRTLPRPREG